MSKPTEQAPFHVVDIKHNGSHVAYEIHCKNRPFLRQAVEPEPAANPLAPAARGKQGRGTPRLKRHEAYAIARLLNGETTLRKWADKFDDPYTDE